MKNIRMNWFFVFGVFYIASVGCVCTSTIYVSATSGNDANNGSTWALAKQTIQAGVDAATVSDTVLVSNGAYNIGGRLPPGQVLCQARVVIDKAVRVFSVNGHSNTFIVGLGPRGETAVRCVWMASNTYLTGFTLTNGYTTTTIDEDGGGVFTRQTLRSYLTVLLNHARRATAVGVFYGTLNNCTLSGNSAPTYAGGAYGGTLNNCTLYGNINGGIHGGTARNTISYGNTGFAMASVSSAFCYTNNPLFVDAAHGNLRLLSNSPCINTGYNPFAPTNVTPNWIASLPKVRGYDLRIAIRALPKF